MLRLTNHRWLTISLLIMMSDQASKALAENYLEPLRSLQLLPGMALTLAYNSGAAFSFLRDAGGWQRYFFVFIGFAVVLFLLRWLRHLPATSGRLGLGLALLLGGTIGNLIDRIATGEVVDFLDVYYGAWHWPAFNLADSAITLGVILLLIDAAWPQAKTNELV